jgi:HEPN domain-containing protein
MGLPKTKEARIFYRAAKQRYEDASLLFEGNHLTGAVYIAGYTVECFLKALLLESVSAALREKLLGEFRGSRAHSFEWLGAMYRRHVSGAIPHDINRHLSRVAVWSTDLRYRTGVFREADKFMESVVAIANWAEGKM